MATTSLNLRPVASTGPTPTTHPAPQPSRIDPWKFQYSGSIDGKEANLLVMFHGLGDTSTPFFNLGKQFSLPATCVLSLQAPFPLPLMDDPSFSWHPVSADDFLLETADGGLPTSLQRLTTHSLPLLLKLFRYLVVDLGWDLERIHLFGWGQGGSTVLELARYIGLDGLEEAEKRNAGHSTRLDGKRLGSATSICGPLLSGLSVNQTLNISTPVFYLTRISTTTTEAKRQKSFLQRTFNPETTTVIAGRSTGKGDARMLQGADEWAPVMKFWSGVLRRGDEQEWMRQASRGGDVYEVVP